MKMFYIKSTEKVRLQLGLDQYFTDKTQNSR